MSFGRPDIALRDALWRPVDARGLALFRILFGATMCFGALRFLWNGWVDRFFVQPTFFFTYWGFEWVRPLPGLWMHAAFVVLAILAAMVSVGFCYRFAIVGFALLFTYIELIDATNYLNHYYFVSLIAVILAFLPAHATWSVDAKLRPAVRSETVPWLAYGWLRFQVATVWLSAALAKFTTDWLLGAQPLNIWLNARVDTPLIGPWLDVWEVALLASWAGFLYDAAVPFLLMFRKTRWAAFAAVLGFHFMTHVWFNIGMFPLIMVTSATIFFGGQPVEARSSRGAWSAPLPGRLLPAFLVAWCSLQIAMPLRYLAYDGNILWHEQGMRWAFKVMCREKNGVVTYRVRLPSERREVQVAPRRYLTKYQEREMSGQPDMILQVAHQIRDEWRNRGHEDVEVYADAIASLNGRPAAPLIDPSVNLAALEDGLRRADWILPAPTSAPPRIGR